MKLCSICSSFKSKQWHANFAKHSQDTPPTTICHVCYMKDYRIKYFSDPINKQANRDKTRAWRKNNYERALATTRARGKNISCRFVLGKRQAMRRKKEWLITIEEFKSIIANPCYYCNNKLGPPTEIGTGLDRLDNTKGYIISNIVSCCNFCNTIKSNKLSCSETKKVITLLILLRAL